MATELPHQSVLLVPKRIGSEKDIELIKKVLHKYCTVLDSGEVELSVGPDILADLAKNQAKLSVPFGQALFTAFGHCLGKGLSSLALVDFDGHKTYETLQEWQEGGKHELTDQPDE